MKRANWIYFVATALVLSTGISVAGARSRHLDTSSTAADRKGHLHGHWGRDATTTTDAPTTTQPVTTTTQRATTTTAAPTTTAVTTTTLVPTPPPPLPSSGAFLSYPHQSAPQSFSGNDVVVSARSYQGFSGRVALEVHNAHNVYLHDLDFDGNGGDIYLVDCTGQIRIENIRARNTGDGEIGSGHSNVIQLSRSFDNGTGGIRGVRALGGDTEDMISIYQSGGVDATHPLVIENVHLESPLSGPLAWKSDSGTGINLADAGGHDIILRNSTLLNAGQVGIQMNEPTRVRVTNNVVYGAARPNSNVGLSQWGSCSTCTGNSYTNNRVWWVKEDGSASPSWLSGNVPVLQSGNVLQDGTIDPNSLRVVL